MPNIPTEQEIDAVRALVACSQLRSVEFYEISARRYESPGEAEEIEEGSARVDIGVQHRYDDSSFGVRLTADINSSLGQARVSAAAEYDLIDTAAFDPSSLDLFANEVGIMAVFPYLREGVSSITGRVFGHPLHLPTVSRGDISIRKEGSEALPD